MALPDKTFLADNGCFGPIAVVVETHGGRGGDPCYAGGFITGHTGHKASLLSQAQLRALGESLIKAADAIHASGQPSFEDRKKRS